MPQACCFHALEFRNIMAVMKRVKHESLAFLCWFCFDQGALIREQLEFIHISTQSSVGVELGRAYFHFLAIILITAMGFICSLHWANTPQRPLCRVGSYLERLLAARLLSLCTLHAYRKAILLQHFLLSTW